MGPLDVNTSRSLVVNPLEAPASFVASGGSPGSIPGERTFAGLAEGGSIFPIQKVPDETRGNPREPEGTPFLWPKRVGLCYDSPPPPPPARLLFLAEPKQIWSPRFPSGSLAFPRVPSGSLGFPRFPSVSLGFPGDSSGNRLPLPPQPPQPNEAGASKGLTTKLRQALTSRGPMGLDI